MINSLSTEEVLVAAVCTGLGDPREASTGARWRAERRPPGLIRTPKRETGVQSFGHTLSGISAGQGVESVTGRP